MIIKNFELDKVMRIEEIFIILSFLEFLPMLRMKTIELKISKYHKYTGCPKKNVH